MCNEFEESHYFIFERFKMFIKRQFMTIFAMLVVSITAMAAPAIFPKPLSTSATEDCLKDIGSMQQIQTDSILSPNEQDERIQDLETTWYRLKDYEVSLCAPEEYLRQKLQEVERKLHWENHSPK